MDRKEISHIGDPAGLVFGSFFNQYAGFEFFFSVKMFEQGGVIPDEELPEFPVMLNAFSKPVSV